MFSRMDTVRIVLTAILTGSLLGALTAAGAEDGAALSGIDLDRVRVGTRAPDFTLESSDGKTISLSDSQGRENVVLVFYRGHW